MPATNPDCLLAALHLASPALPVGGFAYSQGLEQAFEDGWIAGAEGAFIWIRDAMVLGLARQELPLWISCHAASQRGAWGSVREINDRLLALRETAEFRLESVQMGHSMAKLFGQWPGGAALSALDDVRWAYPAAHAALAAISGVDVPMGLTAYLWAWVENQVLAAVKIVPLGQVDGQVLLHRLKSEIAHAMTVAHQTNPDEAGTGAFGLAIASCRHETQYSRLFRS
jgi:urease accessory protein